MDYIIIISMIFIFLLGFVFIDKVCCIIQPANELETKNSYNDEIKTEKALIFGKLPISLNIMELLDKYDVAYALIKDINELNISYSYNYLFAVDDNDFENLMICSICKKMMGINKIISVCNLSNNKKIFEDNHIKYLFGTDIVANQLVFSLLSTENWRQ